MPTTPIFGAGSLGIIKDISDHTLPPEAWTNGRNVEFQDGKVIRTLGRRSVFGTPSVPPTFLLPVEFQGNSYWLYPEVKSSGGKVYAIEAGQHTEISAVGGYSSSDVFEWSGVNFQGVPILNSPGQPPQYWGTIDTGTLLADLPNWTSGDRCKVLSTYKNYLIGLNMSNGSNSFPHRIKWSDGADPGTTPASWDVTDDTFEAGELDLSDVNSGEIVTGGPFGSLFAIYKKDTTWLLRYIGGNLIMSLSPVLLASGILGQRTFCSVTLPNANQDVHFLSNGYDLGTFDGTSFTSVVEKKDLRYLQNAIDSSNYRNAFCFNNPTKEQAIFAYPLSGSDLPNEALVWNYRDNTISFRDWSGVYAANGQIDAAQLGAWDDLVGSWTAQVAPWGDTVRRQVLVADQSRNLFNNLDVGTTNNGAPFTSFVERTGIAIIGMDRLGNPKVDLENHKLLMRVWPKISGGPVNVYCGAADKLGDAPVYGDPVLFDPSDEFEYVDPGDTADGGPPNGRLLAVKFESVGDSPFVIDGFSLEVEVVSGH